MKTLLSAFATLTLALSLTSCATYPDVHKMDDGNNYISFLVARKGDGNRDGMKQAEAFCTKVNRNHAVVVTETFNYVGSVDEEEYSDVKAEAELKKGNRLSPKLPKKDKDVNKPGSAVMVGGEGEKEIQAAKGYEYTLVFRCS